MDDVIINKIEIIENDTIIVYRVLHRREAYR